MTVAEGGCILSQTVDRESLSDKPIFEQRAEEMREPGIGISGEVAPGRKNIKCKGPRKGA